TAIAIREPVAVPRASEDAGRGQHDASKLLAALRAALPLAKPAKTVGTDVPYVAPPPGAGPGAKSTAAPKPALPPGGVSYVPPGGPQPPAPAATAAAPATGPEITIFITDVDLF